MSQVFVDISVSLDGFVAGPDQSLSEPLGKGGEQLHEWVFPLAAWREPHGESGGETNASSEVVQESQERASAVVMGRRMFSGGEGPWSEDPNADAWWGDDPPFHVPVFVVTHHAREPETKQGGTTFTFVTEGVEAAVEQARAVAGERDVHIAGGASVIQQALRAGLIDEVRLNVAPVLLGGGARLLDDLGDEPPALELGRVLAGPAATHLQYRVLR
jgi:dihydrofolate reductase